MKKTAHIISHTHWDREWYLPYETHHMMLIKTMDTLLDTFEKDSNFKYYHLDGQTVLLEDYLEVRPDRKELLEKVTKNIGKVIIGKEDIITQLNRMSINRAHLFPEIQDVTAHIKNRY